MSFWTRRRVNAAGIVRFPALKISAVALLGVGVMAAGPAVAADTATAASK